MRPFLVCESHKTYHRTIPQTTFKNELQKSRGLSCHGCIFKKWITPKSRNRFYHLSQQYLWHYRKNCARDWEKLYIYIPRFPSLVFWQINTTRIPNAVLFTEFGARRRVNCNQWESLIVLLSKNNAVHVRDYRNITFIFPALTVVSNLTNEHYLNAALGYPH